MALLPLLFNPGVNREKTNYANKGGWFDCDKVRFRQGFPEKIGGWVRFSQNTFLGTARSLFGWATLNGEQLYGLGTNLKYYAVQGGGLIDITPLRATSNLGTDPITTVAMGSGVLNVFDDDHGANIGDFVTISGSTGPVDGIAASLINAEHQITDIVDSDNYLIEVAGTATSGSVSGGGSSVVAEYQISVGLDTTSLGLGWGADPWGSGGWGEPASTKTVGEILRLWHQDNFGEDLLFNVRDGAIYYYDVSAGVSTRAVDLTSVSGAENVPTVARQIMVSDNDRHVIAFGCNDIGSSIQDLLLIRWSNQENVTNWTPTGLINGVAASAGKLRLGQGSEIVRAIETQREILVWTDVSLHSFRFLGASEFTFGQERVGTHITILSANAVASTGSEVYWMGDGVFYMYDGVVRPLECDIEEYVFQSLTTLQREKITAGINRQNSEIWWFMPRGSSETAENNFYAVFNYKDKIWYYGTIVRTTWIDSQFEAVPMAAGVDGYIYLHETGNDDGSVIPVAPIEAYITSNPIEVGEGQRQIVTKRLIPDVDFSGSTSDTPVVTVSLTPRNFPGGTLLTADSGTVTRTASAPVEVFTEEVGMRVRGRTLVYEIRSTETGVKWRHGVPRIDGSMKGKQ